MTAGETMRTQNITVLKNQPGTNPTVKVGDAFVAACADKAKAVDCTVK